ncbi:coat protein [army ant associated cyclovirus 5 170_4]|uniref:Coat protein n=1 Tax=army ant associated cyclovirus 5 170_4 TaxID=3070165 RepID=A0AA47KVT7_9CIRC|nr:coat protein [Army ant associated cyclovirus 5]WBG01479.1 coat protein [Army ant associated cyclovirus 5]
MARFRRRVAYRKPVRRVRRRYLRRAFRRRRIGRSRTGSMYCKFTKVASVTVENNVNSFWGASFLPTDFPEYNNIAKNFELCKFLRIRVRVIPLQNVANNSTSALPCYAMLPWHVPITYPKEFNFYLSVDKHKIRRQCEKGTQSYIPNLFVETPSGTPAQTSAPDQIVWKPEIRYHQNTSREPPRIYGGVIVFQGEQEFEGRKASFNIVTDVWVKFKNQSMMYL